MIAAMVLAGGTGSRIGASKPKQFIEVLGKPVLAYTLDLFQANPNIDSIEVVCHKDWVEKVREICSDYALDKVEHFCEGGSSYQESTYNGVMNLRSILSNDDILVSSFGVSPMTPQVDIDDSIRICKMHGNGIASSDITLCTCKKDDEDSTIHGVVRETLKGFANPWSFQYGELYNSYVYARKTGMIECLEPHTTSLYLALGKRLWFSQATAPITKITYRSDLDLFEGWLLLQEKRNHKREKGSI